MSAGPITGRHPRPVPAEGRRWTDYIPNWVKLAAPALTAVVAVCGFVLGIGEGRGAAAEVMRAQAETVAHHTRDLTELREANSRLEGKVDALLGYFRIPAPKEP